MSDDVPPDWPTAEHRERVAARTRALRNRRRATGAGAIALVVAIAAGGLAISRGGSNGSGVRVVAGATTTSSPNPRPATPAIVSDPEPQGWRLVDFGDARIAVPPGWLDAPPQGTSPAPCATTPPGVVQFYLPAENCPTITIGLPPARALPPLPAMTVHGFKLYLAQDSIVSLTYVVPTLHVAITVHDDAAAALLGSLTSSARRVVLGGGSASTIPANWKRVTFGGIALRLPPSMPVTHLAPNYLPPGECSAEPFPTRGAFLGNGDVGIVNCPMIPGGVVPLPTDGVWMHTTTRYFAPQPQSFVRMITVGRLRLALSDAAGNVTAGPVPALDVTIFEPDGHGSPTLVRIGLGADPTIARTILYSIRPA